MKRLLSFYEFVNEAIKVNVTNNIRDLDMLKDDLLNSGRIKIPHFKENVSDILDLYTIICNYSGISIKNPNKINNTSLEKLNLSAAIDLYNKETAKLFNKLEIAIKHTTLPAEANLKVSVEHRKVDYRFGYNGNTSDIKLNDLNITIQYDIIGKGKRKEGYYYVSGNIGGDIRALCNMRDNNSETGVYSMLYGNNKFVWDENMIASLFSLVFSAKI